MGNRRRALLVSLAATLLALAPVGQAAADGPPLDAVRAKARAALARRDPISAEVALREAMRQGAPADALRADLAAALLARGALADAHTVLDGAAQFTPDTAALGWRMRGQLALAEGRLPAAGQAFDQALRLTPDDADLWVAIARLRFAGGEQAQSVQAAARAVALDPRNARALALRGMLVREQFGLRAALPWFEQGLKIHPQDPDLLTEYAATLGDMGQARAMLVVVRKLAEVDPGNPRTLYFQAVLAARAGKTELARTLLQRTGTALRDMPAAMLLGGVLEYRAGNYSVSAGLLARLVRLQPANLQAQQLLARAIAREGDLRQVAWRWDSVARQPFATPYLQATVARAWQGLRQPQRAKDLATVAARMGNTRPFTAIPPDLPLGALALRYQDGPNFADVAVPYVRGLLAARQFDQARAIADRLRAANPGAAEAWLLAGDARMITNDARGALASYDAAAAIRFNEPVLRRMDAALRAAGRAKDADAMTARYLAQNPESLLAMRLLVVAWAGEGRQTEAQAMARALAARGQVL
ncbi:tetratricopeptide repeat protein [Novosphingobium capsulatum]|uniref:tetratricopeptide repeat protein n=1 Tax=Novosphingobium capsulatum TaxID=13688 RepID=UPI000A04524B|nr:tetratricopeptide repeat protein [Novosphingobium capsulatum]WQD92023.1 tetratricopeptide repeat protein [Novosphingobium capsulatum]